MKVIAKVDNTRVLCEVSLEEIAFLNGYKNIYESGFDRDTMTSVGAECNLKRMVTTSQFVRSLRPDLLQKTRDQLEKTLTDLDNTMETVSGLEIFNILQDSEQIGDVQK